MICYADGLNWPIFERVIKKTNSHISVFLLLFGEKRPFILPGVVIFINQ